MLDQYSKPNQANPWLSRESYSSVLDHAVDSAISLNPAAYRDASFHLTESTQVFGKTWVCVGYSCQIKNKGDILPVRVGDQPIIVCRADNQELRAYYNVCRHRGSLLVTEPCRQERIRCPYHSWTYDLQGNLLACPLFQSHQGTGSFDRKAHQLYPVRVASWGPYIFVCLSADTPELREYLGDYCDSYAGFPLDELVLVRRKRYEIKANWKLVAENFLEYYHLPWVHPELTTVTAIDLHKRNQGTGMYMSFYASPLQAGGTAIDADFLPPMPGLTAEQQNSGYFPMVFPNMAQFLMPHHLFNLLMFPRSPGETEEYGDLLVHPSLLDLPDIEVRIDQIFAFYDMVNLQDIRAVELVQEGIAARAYKGGRMCFRFEEPVHRFQKMVAMHMTGDGQPLPGDPLH